VGVDAPQSSTADGQKTTFAFSQEIMLFILRLREKGIGSLDLLRALETVPRDLFVPHRLVDLVWRDISLPIACGQSMPPPMVVARMLEVAQIARHHRVLEIGTGSGYATAILAHVCDELISVERFQTLVVEARARLAHIGCSNVTVLWEDGLALSPEIGRFDRIIVHACLSSVPASLLALLADDGLLVCARPDEGAAMESVAQIDKTPAQQQLALFARDDRWRSFGPCQLPALVAGRALAL
jgi:protein-L-isoaspartate(D-aspartate) O-methyltransferase